jgi:uracil-DNA glycosylase
MNVQIEESWKARLEPEFEKDYFRTLILYGKNIASIRYILRES